MKTLIMILAAVTGDPLQECGTQMSNSEAQASAAQMASRRQPAEAWFASPASQEERSAGLTHEMLGRLSQRSPPTRVLLHWTVGPVGGGFTPIRSFSSCKP
jgi:hypothetical protein